MESCGVPDKFPEFAEQLLHLRPKKGAIQRFRLNSPQLKLESIIEQLQSDKKAVRLLVLKARQFGISTWSLGRGYKYVTTHPGTFGLLVAHDNASTMELFDRLRMMYDLAPYRPMRRKSNRTELEFANPDRMKSQEEPGLLSKFLVGTAGNIHVGTSLTLQYLHGSEVAKWPKADEVLLSLEQAFVKSPESIEILESTARGVDNEFYERWMRASNPRTSGDWTPVFLPWWSFEEYSRSVSERGWSPIPPTAKDERSWLLDEDRQRKLYSLTDDQVNWRRSCIADDCGGRLDKFRQEYPGEPDEAFLASGYPIFDVDKIQNRISFLRSIDENRSSKSERPRMIVGDLLNPRGLAFKWLSRPDGPFRVYRWPVPGRDYVVAADTAEGITKGNDPDYCAASVLDRSNWEQCLVYHGHTTPVEFAFLLYILGKLYNTAILAPESNNHGHTVCAKLEELRYPRLYLRRLLDTMSDQVIEKVGWETNSKTRDEMIDWLDDAIRQDLIKIHDLPTLQELLRFSRNPNTGKVQGGHSHDDLVIATAISLAVHRYGWKKIKPEGREVEFDGSESAMVSRFMSKVVSESRKIGTTSEGDWG